MCELRLSLPPTSAAQMGANQQACKWGAARHMASHLQVSTCRHTNTGPSWLHTQAHTIITWVHVWLHKAMWASTLLEPW